MEREAYKWILELGKYFIVWVCSYDTVLLLSLYVT
jgi:hypothetical protein